MLTLKLMKLTSSVSQFALVALLLISSSCSTRRYQGQQNPVTTQSSPVFMPTQEIIRHDYFSILRVSDEPVALLSVRLTNPEELLLSDLVLEIQNVSGKPVKQVEYGIWPSEMCSDYTYAMTPPCPRILYGSVGGEPPLQPTDKATIKVPNDKLLQTLLNPKTYESCPEAHKKPQLMIQEVHFDDGAVWYPNQKLREESLRKYGASNKRLQRTRC